MKNRATYGHLAFANFPTRLFRPLPKEEASEGFGSSTGVRVSRENDGIGDEQGGLVADCRILGRSNFGDARIARRI